MIFRHLLNMRSHPTWVRGLKLSLKGILCHLCASHPTWVRGLKLKLRQKIMENQSRTLRGCVD